jgi:hypothetical protein
MTFAAPSFSTKQKHSMNDVDSQGPSRLAWVSATGVYPGHEARDYLGTWRRLEVDFGGTLGRDPRIARDPSFFRNKPLLDLHPLIARSCDKAWLPEDLV